MNSSAQGFANGQGFREHITRILPEISTFRRQLGLLKWLIPLGLMLLVVAYEIGPSRWINNGLGFSYHLLVEILLFGTVGPVLAFVVLVLLGRWIDERETADLQARMLAQANEKEQEVRQLNDDILQVFFGTSLLITAFKSDQPELQASTAAQIEATEQALGEAMERLHAYLMDNKS